MPEQQHDHPREAAVPLSFAIISVDRMAASLDFYGDLIGFDIVAQGVAGPGLAALLGLRTDVTIKTALLCAIGCDVGRILLIEVEADNRQLIRRPGDRTTRGLWNLNFYVADIRRVAQNLRAKGFELWSEPVEYDVGAAGRAIEVLFEAPDGVAINLVQPLGDRSVFTGRIRAELEVMGYTRGGFTPVATTAHCVHSLDAAADFYQRLLGLEVVLDEVLGKPETNRFLQRPADAKSRSIFLSADHPFGKLSLNEPLNYPVPERVSSARAPNIGYLAQAFEVSDFDSALARVAPVQAGLPQCLDVVGFAARRAVSLNCPGSGAAAWIVEIGK